jgi:hypothetical protein
MFRLPLTLLAVICVVGSTSQIAPAQTPLLEAWAEGPSTPEDSARLVAAARRDQASFERFRRNHLPETWGGGSSRCDERIGRFCLTHGRGHDDWVAPPEDEEVVAVRGSLIDGLGQIQEIIPGDDWISGQHVRYLVEARRLDEALAAAEECRGEPSWCAALRGYVLHYSAQPAAADSAFDEALAAMEDEERRRWSDLSLILDDRTVRSYRRIDGEERQPFERRFWHLSDPLLTRAGNELRSEHLSRHVMDQFQYRAQSADGISWGFDLREILIRYGWPTGWERTREFGMTAGPPPLVSHYSSSPHYLLPPSEALLEESGTGGVWDDDLFRSRTGYNIPLEDSIARWFSPLDHQVAVFRRGDEAIVVAGYELPADSVPDDAEVLAGVAVLPTTDLLAEPRLALDEAAAVSGALMARVPAQPSLMSLEVVVPSERRLARARYGIELAPVIPGLVSLSDLLLLRETDSLPDSLEAAVEVARGSSELQVGERIGIFWEIYGLDSRETPELSMSLRLLQSRTGWLRRLAERAGLLREVTPVRLRWQEPVSPGPFMARSLDIQVPDVSPGSYTLELVVDAVGREPLTVRKEIEVAE